MLKAYFFLFQFFFYFLHFSLVINLLNKNKIENLLCEILLQRNQHCEFKTIFRLIHLIGRTDETNMKDFKYNNLRHRDKLIGFTYF